MYIGTVLDMSTDALARISIKIKIIISIKILVFIKFPFNRFHFSLKSLSLS